MITTPFTAPSVQCPICGIIESTLVYYEHVNKPSDENLPMCVMYIFFGNGEYYYSSTIKPQSYDYGYSCNGCSNVLFFDEKSALHFLNTGEIPEKYQARITGLKLKYS